MKKIIGFAILFALMVLMTGCSFKNDSTRIISEYESEDGKYKRTEWVEGDGLFSQHCVSEEIVLEETMKPVYKLVR